MEILAAQAHRWALLGNAVSVQVAVWIGRALMQPHRHKYHAGARDRRFIGMALEADAADGVCMMCPTGRCFITVHKPEVGCQPQGKLFI
jgi:hypothetical protein